MATWMKMGLTVLVAVMPGGFVFLFCWAVWRAWSARWHTAQVEASAGEGVPPSPLRLLATLEVRDLLREARSFSGIMAPGAGR